MNKFTSTHKKISRNIYFNPYKKGDSRHIYLSEHLHNTYINFKLDDDNYLICKQQVHTTKRSLNLMWFFD